MTAGAPEVRRFPGMEEMSAAAVALFGELARESVAARGRFSLALSGGRTPQTLYEGLAAAPPGEIPWEKTHLFWGDERCVPADRPESNYDLARRTFISRVPVPPDQVHRIHAELDPPEDAAALYEETLRGFFGEAGPAFDLMLLGVGEDGHTASLFPGDPALEESKRWVVAVTAPPGVLPERRITLTYPVIGRSRAVLFLAAARRKRDLVNAILAGGEEAACWPAARVRGERVIWFVAGGPA